MVIIDEDNSFGAWAFLAGVVLAVIIGVGTSSFLSIQSLTKYSTQIYGILVLLGLLVGFSIRATGKDAQTFLITGAILVIVSSLGQDSITGTLIGVGLIETVSSTFAALSALFVPATIIVALKTLFSMAKI